MNILITGCNGQLGSELQLLEPQYAQHTFVNTDVAELDITDEQAVMNFVVKNNINGIINCAAYTAVDKAESNADLAHRLNALAPEYLAKAAEKRQGWMIQISTDYVFDGTAHTPYTEDCPTCPQSVYGTTKLEGEQRAMVACRRAIIIRTAWLYSRFGNNFVKTMIRLGRERETLGVVADQIGTPTNAADLARAIMTIVEQIKEGLPPLGEGRGEAIFHFSNEGVCSWYDFTKAIHRLAGITTCDVKPLHTTEYPTPATRPAYSVLDKTKIKQTFGITIPHWEESLERSLSPSLPEGREKEPTSQREKKALVNTLPNDDTKRQSYQTAEIATYNLTRENAKHNRANATEAESVLWQSLRGNALGAKFRRQHVIGEYIVDFVCLSSKLIVEVDGGYHTGIEQNENDEQREKFLRSKGYKVIRFANEEVLSNTDHVVSQIKSNL